MAEKKLYIGSVGPLLFDDTDPINDADGDFPGELYHGFVTNCQMLITEAPDNDYEVMRLGDTNKRILDPLAVTDIDDPSTELGAKVGIAGTLILVYQVKATRNEATLYEWDDADSEGADIPYVVAGSSGFWIAVGGKNKCSGSLFHDFTESPLLVIGGELSEGTTPGTLKVGTIIALLRDEDSETGTLVYVTKAEEDNISLVAQNTVYLVVLNYNNGSPTISLEGAYPNLTQNINIGLVMDNTDTGIFMTGEGGFRLCNFPQRTHLRSIELRASELASGSVPSYIGTNNLSITAGVVYAGTNRGVFAVFDSSGVTDKFVCIYRAVGAGDFTYVADQTVIDFAHYDDGDGTLGTVGVAKYGVHWLYRTYDGCVFLVYGYAGNYSLEQAEDATAPSIPDFLSAFGLLIGKIIMPHNGGSFTTVQMVTDTFFSGTAISVHNDLGGLNSGDYKHLTAANHTDLTDGGDTTLHDHDGISENTGARHTQGTDTALGAQVENLDMNTHQIEALSIPDAAGEAIRQTVKITEAELESIIDVSPSHATKTTAAWNKSIGSGGDYADWATMIADMPDLIAHAVTVTIEAGTTLTEICNLKNKAGLTSEATITIQAEKYYPTASALPTADSATATTLRDAELATAALGNDYFNGCWIQIVDGTGTDNGFILITDYVDATGDVVVANWPGTQPDNTSRYLIVGALIDGGGIRIDGINAEDNSLICKFCGIGIENTTITGWNLRRNTFMTLYYCGIDDIDVIGVYFSNNIYAVVYRCGITRCNTLNNAAGAGVKNLGSLRADVYYCGISDNNQRGILVEGLGSSNVLNNFGDNNGDWGTYAQKGGQADVTGVSLSGGIGVSSDTGTADTASADQAVVY